MATPNIVPRADSEGGIGTASKYWASAYIDFVYVGAGKVGRDADNLLDFSADNQISIKIAGSNEIIIDSSQMFPATNDGMALGYPGNGWSNLFLASGAVINFDNGNVTLTHGSGAITSSGHIVLNDSKRLKFGGGHDLEIYHDASNSYITQQGTGHLIISQTTDDGDIVFQCDDGSGGNATYIRVDGGQTRTEFSKPTLHEDNVIANFGSSSDMQMYHNGTNSFLLNTEGDLEIINFADDKDIIFKSDDGSGGVTEYLTLDGSASRIDISKFMRFADGVEARFGAQSDLQVHHDGSNSYISQNGTGDLYIKQMTADEDLIFQCDDGAGGDATYFYLDGSSAEHNGSATTALYTNWPDNSRISLGTSHDLQLDHNSTDSIIRNQTGDLYIMNKADDKDIIFQSDDGSGGVTTYLALDGSSNIMIGYKSLYMLDDKRLYLGTAGDLELYHDATNSIIRNQNGNLTIENTHDDGDIIFKSDDGSGSTTTYFQLDGGLGYTVAKKQFLLDDNVQLSVGTSEHGINMIHDGSNSTISNAIGNLTILNYQNDGDIIFQSDDGSGGTTTYFFLDGSSLTTRFEKDLRIVDNIALTIGNVNDLILRHNATNSEIINNTGNLEIRNQQDDGDIIFKSDDGSGGTTTYVKLDGSATTTVFHKDTRYDDSVKAKFGADSDLQIYHDGTDSFIANLTGDLAISNSQDDGDIRFQTDNGSGGVTTYIQLDGGDVSTIVNTIKIMMPNLPTSDPSTAGQLWNDSGTLKISAG